MKVFLLAIIILGSLSCTRPQQNTPVEVQNLTTQEFKRQRMSSKTRLIDVRTPEEFADGHLTGAINSDYRGGDFAEEIKTWKKDKVYYLYCATGNRSGKAAELMKAAGFQHIYNIGGYQELREAGLPTEQGMDE